MSAFQTLSLTRESAAEFSLSDDFWRVERPELKMLHVQGTSRAFGLLGQLPARGLAVVGTREPLTRSLNEVRRTLLALAGRELIIVSGMARGIDAAAHESAIQAGLPTVAILGASLDCEYPKVNLQLRERILRSDGLIISEYPEGTPPHAGNFLRRNRLIAAWSKAVWVVEAGFRSGALNTAKYARDCHRDLYATACFPGDPALCGNQELIDRHHALPCWGAHSFGTTWSELAWVGPERNGRTASKNLTDSERFARQVHLIALERNRAHVSELLDWATTLGWEPARFFSALTQAVETGLVLDENGLLLKNPHHYS